MILRFLVSVILIFLFSGVIHAETFDEYKSRLDTTCESDKPWTDEDAWGGNTVEPPNYSELTKTAIEWARSRFLSETTTPDEQARLARDLDASSLRRSGFRTLELARVMYRSRMNRVFACSVILARENITKNLLTEIEKKYPTPQSEIKEKIRREWEKLKIQKQSLGCKDPSGEEATPLVKRVINSATRQYCHYDSYLRYVRDSFSENADTLLSLDANLWSDGENIPNPDKMEGFARTLAYKWELITSELLRARSLLPVAVKTFQEMERTYAMHLLLIVIADDYLRLRDNLAIYFNSVTQLMEKMQNAQLPNNQ